MELFNIRAAECIGYALEQNYTRHSGILCKYFGRTDEEQLLELKNLAVTYNIAVSKLPEDTTLRNKFDSKLIDVILSAFTIDECYRY